LIFVEAIKEIHAHQPRAERLKLINLIDKLNFQRDLLDIARGNVKISDIKAAGKHLGKKAQLSYEKG